MTQHKTHSATSLAESLAAYVRDDEAIQHVYRLATRQARLPRDSLIARELVTDVIEDLFMGEATCNPERKVAPQVEREVLRRANRLRKANRPRGKRRDATRPELIPLDQAPASALLVAPLYRGARERLARYAEMALLAASTSPPAVQPRDEDVQDAALPVMLARASSGRTARVRRAVRRQRDRVRRLRSA